MGTSMGAPKIQASLLFHHREWTSVRRIPDRRAFVWVPGKGRLIRVVYQTVVRTLFTNSFFWLGLVTRELVARDDHAMHFIGAISEAQCAGARIHIGQGSPLRYAGRAV